jgi:hypothetical protein
VLQVGVVVDLHDDEALVDRLDVDAVEALADRAGRAPSGRSRPQKNQNEPLGIFTTGGRPSWTQGPRLRRIAVTHGRFDPRHRS